MNALNLIQATVEPNATDTRTGHIDSLVRAIRAAGFQVVHEKDTAGRTNKYATWFMEILRVSGSHNDVVFQVRLEITPAMAHGDHGVHVRMDYQASKADPHADARRTTDRRIVDSKTTAADMPRLDTDKIVGVLKAMSRSAATHINTVLATVEPQAPAAMPDFDVVQAVCKSEGLNRYTDMRHTYVGVHRFSTPGIPGYQDLNWITLDYDVSVKQEFKLYVLGSPMYSKPVKSVTAIRRALREARAACNHALGLDARAGASYLNRTLADKPLQAGLAIRLGYVQDAQAAGHTVTATVEPQPTSLRALESKLTRLGFKFSPALGHTLDTGIVASRTGNSDCPCVFFLAVHGKIEFKVSGGSGGWAELPPRPDALLVALKDLVKARTTGYAFYDRLADKMNRACPGYDFHGTGASVAAQRKSGL